jgi:hypothetical protein
MKRLLASAVAVLSWTVAAAHADDPQWRPAAPRSAATSPIATAGVTLGSPVALGRPVALTPTAPSVSPVYDPAVTRVSYEVPATLARPVVRAQGFEGTATWNNGDDRTPSTSGTSSFATLGTPTSTVHTTGFTGDPPPPEALPPGNAGPFGGGPTGFADGGFGSGCCCDSCCCDPCCNCWDSCGCCNGHHLYASAEYLMWWIRGASLPALITTGPAAIPGPVLSLEGALGQPGTSIVFGAGNQRYDISSGARFTAGYWFDCCDSKAIEFSYFFIGPRSFSFTANSGQFPVLARPFFNVNNMIEFAEVTASPGLSTGSITVNSRSELWGTEANLRCNVCCDCDFRFDVIGGFRFLELTENLDIIERINVLPTVPVLGGDTIVVADRFGTRNEFAGGQIGGIMSAKCEHWTLDLTAKFAFGNNHQIININGSQAIRTPAGAVTVVPGGLLALNSNSGRFTQDRFSFVPEWGAKVGYCVTDHLKLTIGYTFLYWTNVVRPGDQIDRNLNINQIPNFTTGPPSQFVRPVVPFRELSFWAQGLSFGLEYTY